MVLVDLPLPERGKLLAREYDHFISNPQSLKDTLDGLRKLRGHEQVDEWHRQIDACDWTTFLESILLKHYDLCYRRPGSEDSIYSEPIATLSVTSAIDSDYEKAAADLISNYS